MWRRVALVRTDVSDNRVAFFIRKKRISNLWKNVSSNYSVFLRSVLRFLVIVNVVPSSLILFTLMMEAISSPETSVLTRASRLHTREDGIPHSHRRENLKSVIRLTGWVLQWRRNVFPVWYELGSYVPEDYIPHSHRREKFTSYTVLLQFRTWLSRRLPSHSHCLPNHYVAVVHV
jgi:hypothetical protein